MIQPTLALLDKSMTQYAKRQNQKRMAGILGGAATGLQSFVQFSFYCGVGHRTIIGIGQTHEIGKQS